MSLAKKLISWYESPMQVAYFLNGSDATSLALRIARAHTGRHTIFSCGYHGWQDWSQPESSGVLLYERKYSKKFNYGEVSSLVSEIEIKKNEVAVVMLETPFPSNFIKEIKQICKIAKEANVLIAFDEVKAGGRVGFTSGQDSSGVEPDFALYGKVFGGGLPLSFMLVKKILAQKVPNDTFLSSTFWGYPLALNMADAVVDRINSSDELTILKKRADKFIKNINHFTTTHHIPLMFYGESLMPSLQIDEKYSHAFYTACFAHGLYIRPNHCWFLSVAHTDAVLDESYELLQSVIKKVFTI
jgi:glutamate-1-semialdehyde aminotransferase